MTHGHHVIMLSSNWNLRARSSTFSDKFLVRRTLCSYTMDRRAWVFFLSCSIVDISYKSPIKYTGWVRDQCWWKLNQHPALKASQNTCRYLFNVSPDITVSFCIDQLTNLRESRDQEVNYDQQIRRTWYLRLHCDLAWPSLEMFCPTHPLRYYFHLDYFLVWFLKHVVIQENGHVFARKYKQASTFWSLFTFLRVKLLADSSYPAAEI